MFSLWRRGLVKGGAGASGDRAGPVVFFDCGGVMDFAKTQRLCLSWRNWLACSTVWPLAECSEEARGLFFGLVFVVLERRLGVIAELSDCLNLAAHNLNLRNALIELAELHFLEIEMPGWRVYLGWRGCMLIEHLRFQPEFQPGDVVETAPISTVCVN